MCKPKKNWTLSLDNNNKNYSYVSMNYSHFPPQSINEAVKKSRNRGKQAFFCLNDEAT